MTKARIVVQARIGSTRLPAKIMAPLAGRPLLAQLIARLRALPETPCPVELVVATTCEVADDITAALCRELSIPCVHGPTQDVLARYVDATADLADNDVVLRATADNPLYCPRTTAAILRHHLDQGNDYTCISGLSYVVPEVVRVGALRAMAARTSEDYDREHVTPYFRRDGHEFRVEQLPSSWQGLRPDLRLTVDTPAEYTWMARLFSVLGEDPATVPRETVYGRCDAMAAGGGRDHKTLDQLRVAVVGLGSIGNRHLANLAALGASNRIVVRRPDANPAFSPPAGVRVVHSNEAAIRGGLDLAVICNPSSLHVQTAWEYVEAGVPVLVEKPLATDAESAGKLASLAAARHVPAGVAYCMRYHPAYLAARQIIGEGQLGQMSSARAWFEAYLPDWHPWEDYRCSYAARRDLGGGALRTLDHELDFLNWCLGEPGAVSGCTSHSGPLEIDADDRAQVALQYPGEVAGNVSLSLSTRDPSRGFEFVGEADTLRFHMQSGRLTLHVEGTDQTTVLWQDDGYDLNRMYADLLADALRAVARGDKQLPIPLAAGVSTASVCDAVEQSAGRVQLTNASQ